MQQPIVWIALLGALVLAAGVLAWWTLRERKPAPLPLPSDWAVNPRPVFNSDERRVYRQLREALPHHIVLAKLPLIRFCQPADPQDVRYWYDLLGSAHVAFAVCSANGRVLAAIDLEGDRTPSRRLTQIKQNVLAACRVRYLRCPVDHVPSVPELQLLVPQQASGARGPQSASSMVALVPGTGTPRRRERSTLWQDSSSFHDSFFGVDGPRDADSTISGFGLLGADAATRRRDAQTIEPPQDVGGVVVESARMAAPARH
jgi:hypothetical protein